MGQSNFLHLWHRLSYRAFRFGTHVNSRCLELYWFSSWLCNFWPLGGHKHSKKGISAELPATGKYLSLFYMFWDMNSKSGTHIWQVERQIKFEFHHNQVSASGEFSRFFLNVLRHQFESWFIHSIGCTKYWVQVSPEWGPCDLLHVLSLHTVNWPGWQTGILGCLWLLLFFSSVEGGLREASGPACSSESRAMWGLWASLLQWKQGYVRPLDQPAPVEAGLCGPACSSGSRAMWASLLQWKQRYVRPLGQPVPVEAGLCEASGPACSSGSRAMWGLWASLFQWKQGYVRPLGQPAPVEAALCEASGPACSSGSRVVWGLWASLLQWKQGYVRSLGQPEASPEALSEQ